MNARRCAVHEIDRVLSRPHRLVLVADHAPAMGNSPREAALARCALGRFLADWNELPEEVASR
ncbi:MAG: hypothetical protein M3M94_05980 [Actinomycetota bacterium]|nr:hypothetical protein [Actinomycetota bacterium]